MKVISWNVNGLRASITKGLGNFLSNTDADVVCLQEIKVDEDTYKKQELDKLFPTKFESYPHFATSKKGYSGLITLTKTKPLSIAYGLSNSVFDIEGRVLTLEYPNCYVVNVYFPHTSRDLSRLPFKLSFNKTFFNYIQKLGKPVIIAGDFNVAHTPQDIARAKQNEGNAGFTKEEREYFSELLSAGYIDSFRHMRPDGVKYSWWLQGFLARERNIGWRIDYTVISKELQQNLVAADISTNIYGSDHCPVWVDLKI